LVGRQEGHPACKKTEWLGAGVVICAYGPADATATHWYQLTQAVPDKGLCLNIKLFIVYLLACSYTVSVSGLQTCIHREYRLWQKKNIFPKEFLATFPQ